MGTILQEIVFLLKALIDAFTRHMATLHEVLAKKDETVLGLPESVFYTVIGSIVSAGVILWISSLYTKRREREKTIKERSEYEPFLYQYLTDIADLSQRQAELIDDYISYLESKVNINKGLAHAPKASVKYFFQLQPNVIYNCLILNKQGDTDKKKIVFSAIISAISHFDASLEYIAKYDTDFASQYQKCISELNMYLEEYHHYFDDFLANREKYLLGSESTFYMQLDEAIKKQQAKELETTNIYSTIDFCEELLRVSKPHKTKSAIILTRILINVRFRFNDAEAARVSHISVLKRTTNNLMGLSQDLKSAIESSKEMPLVK